jgi:hypothetical protein
LERITETPSGSRRFNPHSAPAASLMLPPYEDGLRSLVEWRRSDERRAVPEQA